MKRFLFATVAVVCWITANASAAPAPAEAALRDRWLASMKDFNIPGAVVVAVKQNQVVFIQPLGLRDVERDKPVTPDTVFYIASCTKSFMSMAMNILADEGKVDLDAPVKKYLPRFKIADPKLSDAVTIRDLLSHKYGIDSDHITFAEAYSGLITDEMFFEQLKDAQAKGSFKYTNLHYTILGRVIQQVTGMSWKDFLAERIFKPAGMTRTTAYASKMYGGDDFAVPYDHNFDHPIPATLRKTDRTMHAAGGMGTSGSDVARWLILNLNEGQIDGVRIVSEARCRDMQHLYSAERTTRKILHQHVRLGYGLGWVVGTYRDHPMIQHNGGYIGAIAHISFLPDDKIGVAVLVNTDGPAGGWADIIAAEVYDRLLEVKDPEDALAKFKKAVDDGPRKQTPPAPITGDNPAAAKDGLSQSLDAYVGTYAHPTLGQLQVASADGKLTLALGEIKPALVSTGTNKFATIHTGGTIREGFFEVSPDGKVTAVRITFEDNEEAKFARRSP